VEGVDEPELVLACVAAGRTGTAVGSSLPQAARATMAISMSAPINILWDFLNMGRFLIRLYKPVPPKIYGPLWWPEASTMLDQAWIIPNMTRMTF
jgi:hypothetical protein